MLEYKQGAQARVPVMLTDSTTGAALTGVAYGAVTAYVKKADGTVVQVTLDGTVFAEVTGGNFSGAGLYNLLVPGSALDQPGPLQVCVTTSGADPFVGILKVVANEVADVKSDTAAITTAVGAIPTNPLLTNDSRLPTLASGKVVAAVSDLPAAPDNTGIANAESEAAAARESADEAAAAAEATEDAVHNIKPATGFVHLG